jgi:alkanesulfonate monooxygenase SsuD/methylene tetrahydromethanopterin reductase-like flavin-dependent oxidoreductase (luciferase family)
VAERVQSLWVSGDKEAATRAVPDEFVLATMLVGTPAMVRERIRAYAAAGITTLRIEASGAGLGERIADLEEQVALIREATA